MESATQRPSLPTLDTRDGVFVLDLGDEANRFSPGFVAAIEEALDAVEAHEGPKALVTHARGKSWSQGLDLEWLGANASEIEAFVARVQRLMARVLVAPFPTVAAIQGHCFAAGAMLSLAHDRRVMRADRGFWCLPEADIGMAFTPGMSALITRRLPPQTAHEAMLTAERYGGTAALAAGIVEAAVPEDELLDHALGYAAAQSGRAGATMAAIKRGMYGEAHDLLAAGAMTF